MGGVNLESDTIDSGQRIGSGQSEPYCRGHNQRLVLDRIEGLGWRIGVRSDWVGQVGLGWAGLGWYGVGRCKTEWDETG